MRFDTLLSKKNNCGFERNTKDPHWPATRSNAFEFEILDIYQIEKSDTLGQDGPIPDVGRSLKTCSFYESSLTKKFLAPPTDLTTRNVGDRLQKSEFQGF